MTSGTEHMSNSMTCNTTPICWHMVTAWFRSPDLQNMVCTKYGRTSTAASTAAFNRNDESAPPENASARGPRERRYPCRSNGSSVLDHGHYIKQTCTTDGLAPQTGGTVAFGQVYLHYVVDKTNRSEGECLGRAYADTSPASGTTFEYT